jgi:hypothetical protein
LVALRLCHFCQLSIPIFLITKIINKVVAA